MTDSALPPFVWAIVGYAFALVGALVLVNLWLHRLTRGDRGRRRNKPPRA